MFASFADCLKGLMFDDGLDDAQGGLISKVEGGYQYSLDGQPEPEGEPYLGVYPGPPPEKKWKAFYHHQNAEYAYLHFIEVHGHGDALDLSFLVR
jgi:hypothetical protein